MQLFLLVHASTCSLFDHSQHLGGFHVDDLCDSSLHDEKVRIVHVQLNRMEEVLNSLYLCRMAVDEVFVSSTNDNLERSVDGTSH